MPGAGVEPARCCHRGILSQSTPISCVEQRKAAYSLHELSSHAQGFVFLSNQQDTLDLIAILARPARGRKLGSDGLRWAESFQESFQAFPSRRRCNGAFR